MKNADLDNTSSNKFLLPFVSQQGVLGGLRSDLENQYLPPQELTVGLDNPSTSHHVSSKGKHLLKLLSAVHSGD